MEWICDRMSAANVAKATFTEPLLQYLDYLVGQTDNLKRNDAEEEMLYKVCKLIRWIEHLLPGDKQPTETKSLEVFVEDCSEQESETEDEDQREVDQGDKSEYAMADCDPSIDEDEQDCQEYNLQDEQQDSFDNNLPRDGDVLKDRERYIKFTSDFLGKNNFLPEQLIGLQVKKQRQLQRAMTRYWRRLCRSIKRDCEMLLD